MSALKNSVDLQKATKFSQFFPQLQLNIIILTAVSNK